MNFKEYILSLCKDKVVAIITNEIEEDGVIRKVNEHISPEINVCLYNQPESLQVDLIYDDLKEADIVYRKLSTFRKPENSADEKFIPITSVVIANDSENSLWCINPAFIFESITKDRCKCISMVFLQNSVNVVRKNSQK